MEGRGGRNETGRQRREGEGGRSRWKEKMKEKTRDKGEGEKGGGEKEGEGEGDERKRQTAPSTHSVNKGDSDRGSNGAAGGYISPGFEKTVQQQSQQRVCLHNTGNSCLTSRWP